MDSGAPTLPGPRPPLDSDSNPSKEAPSVSLNDSPKIAPEDEDATGLTTRGIASGVGDIDINGATPLVTTECAPAIEVVTSACAGIAADATGMSTAGTRAVACKGGDAQGAGAVTGFTMAAEGTVLLVLLPAPPATLPPVIALGNENTPTDAMDFRAFN